MDSVYNKLIALGIRPSIQRVAIMKYLATHHTHPTVEEVFLALKKQLPTVSRTTVYNTLRMLSEHGAASMITIDDHRVCYDGITEPHATLLLQDVARRFMTLRQWKCHAILAKLVRALELMTHSFTIKGSVLTALRQ